MKSYNDRNGPWMETASGKRFYPLDFRVEDVDINDLAIGIAREGRFANQYRLDIPHYSVAQHSYIGSLLIDQKFAFEFLMHDASEGFLKDVPKPLKILLQDYQKIEENISAVIFNAFNLPKIMPKEVKETDMRMLFTEKRDIMNEQIWDEKYKPFDFKINEFWQPKEAYELFLTRFYELKKNYQRNK